VERHPDGYVAYPLGLKGEIYARRIVNCCRDRC
jgi:hypothetical protein